MDAVMGEVGLKYQEDTPLLQGHVDSPRERSAESYAAEAARCLSKLQVDEACACYKAALEVEPKAPWLLDAFGSLLADMGRTKEALKLFKESVVVEPRGSHVKHMYVGQFAPGEVGIRHLRTGVEILDARRLEARKRPASDAGGAGAGGGGHRRAPKPGEGAAVVASGGAGQVTSLPYTLHPTPSTLHTAPYTLHLTPYAGGGANAVRNVPWPRPCSRGTTLEEWTRRQRRSSRARWPSTPPPQMHTRRWRACD